MCEKCWKKFHNKYFTYFGMNLDLNSLLIKALSAEPTDADSSHMPGLMDKSMLLQSVLFN